MYTCIDQTFFKCFMMGVHSYLFSVGTRVDPLLAVYIIVGVLTPFIFIGLVVLFCCLRKKFCE